MGLVKIGEKLRDMTSQLNEIKGQSNVSFWKMYESLSCLSLVAESNFFCRLRKIPLLNLKLEKKVFLSPLRYNLFQSKCRFSIKLKFEVQVLLVDTSDVLIFEHCECRALLAL